ncbi:uncharacterized protein EV422DRAFT_568901 [Fimicolochytrium jonesii]|uniref:uncharacterized protein n=1 Tax=Fimicolochytrium jonesii TaxID=1396493 RepID=UPI0022FEA579|nr:uncharacterized protein EV422DRAFT_568901 [Fimicolochytrium jonesii]KAI8819469.1 hypothetical protein EV422DRAFT_568901 [Fimicolochytrium jonesii]
MRTNVAVQLLSRTTTPHGTCRLKNHTAASLGACHVKGGFLYRGTAKIWEAGEVLPPLESITDPATRTFLEAMVRQQARDLKKFDAPGEALIPEHILVIATEILQWSAGKQPMHFPPQRTLQTPEGRREEAFRQLQTQLCNRRHEGHDKNNSFWHLASRLLLFRQRDLAGLAQDELRYAWRGREIQSGREGQRRQNGRGGNEKDEDGGEHEDEDEDESEDEDQEDDIGGGGDRGDDHAGDRAAAAAGDGDDHGDNPTDNQTSRL